MNPAESLEIYVLRVGDTRQATVLGRRGNDIVVEEIEESRCQSLLALSAFRERIERSVSGTTQRPSKDELSVYGAELFNWLFQGQIRSMYDRLPESSVSVQLTSNWHELKRVPWEYLSAPNTPAPSRQRSVVRVLPGLSAATQLSAPRRKRLKVLFVTANPIDQQGVTAKEVLAVLERSYEAQLPGRVKVKVVQAASRRELDAEIAGSEFDVFHFFGHGTLRDGVGHLVLVDVESQRSDFVSANTLAQLLSGKRIRLAILSACLTGASEVTDDFGMVATALIRAGIPAVVANQFSIPTKSVASFVGALYQCLLRTGNIDRAVMDGRIALAAELSCATKSAVIEWGIPTLYRMAGLSQILRP